MTDEKEITLPMGLYDNYLKLVRQAFCRIILDDALDDDVTTITDALMVFEPIFYDYSYWVHQAIADNIITENRDPLGIINILDGYVPALRAEDSVIRKHISNLVDEAKVGGPA